MADTLILYVRLNTHASHIVLAPSRPCITPLKVAAASLAAQRANLGDVLIILYPAMPELAMNAFRL